MIDRYVVIKDIPKGWDTGALEGDILTAEQWAGELTLMKDGEPVCDLDSEYGRDYCIPIK
jgi:hypothetical protein